MKTSICLNIGVRLSARFISYVKIWLYFFIIITILNYLSLKASTVETNRDWDFLSQLKTYIFKL